MPTNNNITMPFKDYKIDRIQRNDNNCYVFVNYYKGEHQTIEGKEVYMRTEKMGEERFRFPPKSSTEEILKELNKKFTQSNSFEPIPEQKHAPKK